MHPIYLLLALDSPFSRPVLQTMLESGNRPTALILPNPDRTAPAAPLPPFPVTSSPFHLFRPAPSITTLASQHDIPLLTLGNLRHPDTLLTLRSYQPDLIIAACFPWLLPAEILAIPRLGCLNLHPSLLPAYRGPEPLFWQFYYGETHTGVTLHFMDEHADTGDIVSQAEVPFPAGTSLSHAETLTSQAGAELLCRALADSEPLPRTSQSQPGASYHPRPTSNELIIPTSWKAKRAFNFLCAARDWGPFKIVTQGTEAQSSGQYLLVRGAVGYAEGFDSVSLHDTGAGEVWVRFTDGMVKVRHT